METNNKKIFSHIDDNKNRIVVKRGGVHFNKDNGELNALVLSFYDSTNDDSCIVKYYFNEKKLDVPVSFYASTTENTLNHLGINSTKDFLKIYQQSIQNDLIIL